MIALPLGQETPSESTQTQDDPMIAPPLAPRRSSSARSGASAVEFALLLPFLGILVIGMLEIGRGLMVKEMLSDAAQKGCRTAALPGKSNSDVQADVANIMSDNGVTGYTTTILVNGVAADVATANCFDQISVKVAVPISSVYWTTTFFLTSQMLESETVVMMRQG
jgi:Flp pilus assembly protein TadG